MLKVKCLENKDYGEGTYLGYITYKDLVRFSFMKPLTVNRITDENRIDDMVEYIHEDCNSYPPIVVAIEEKCEVEYSDSELELTISNGSDKRLVIIDGQHRVLSIKAMLEKQDDSKIKNKRQAIYFLSGLNEYNQRKVFLDINDKMKRVSSTSKKIFESTEANYITLKTITDLKITKNINIKNDQCTKMYPYKFILEANRLIFKDIIIEESDDYIEELDGYAKKSKIIWGEIFGFIDKYTNLSILTEKNEYEIDKEKNHNALKTEAFIIEIIKKMIEDYENLSNVSDSNDEKLKTEVKMFLCELVNKYKFFEYEDKINDKVNKKEKSIVINKILKGENV